MYGSSIWRRQKDAAWTMGPARLQASADSVRVCGSSVQLLLIQI